MASLPELSSFEKELFNHTNEGNYDEVKRLITIENVNVNCVDGDRMTPLQHAAYKGAYDLCKLLLDCGADVNLSRHDSEYSALMFAGLSGNGDVVRLLLEHGASPTSVNSINKTAAQMSAFVGNHHVVSIINNFIPIEEIEYFTTVQGLEKEPKLPLPLATLVHKLAIMTNINPVRIALFIQSNPCLLEESKKVSKVFTILSEKKFKEENELLSLKFHHLSFVLNACEKFYQESKSKPSPAEQPINECLNPLIKRWIKGDASGFPIGLETFLRQDIRDYPHIECSLFQQLVRVIAGTKLTEEPTAISIISEAVTGQHQLSKEENAMCLTCGNPNATKKCSACKVSQYCDRICQKLHWFTHKTQCSILAQQYPDMKTLNLNSDPVDKGPDVLVKPQNSES